MLQLKHNIVNLLYSAKGLIEAHLSRVEEGRFDSRESMFEHAEEILKKVYVQADEAMSIVKRLGFLLEAREKKNPNGNASVKECWSKTLRLLKNEFSFGKIEIVERIPENFPAVQCDPEEFKEILYHLSKNALQAMQSGGKLALRAQVIFSAAETPCAQITLSDSGPGISLMALARIFDPFFTTKPPEEGNGLGLYLTKTLVTKNGGKITASSFEGYGTTFTMEFPLSSQSAVLEKGAVKP